MDALLEVLEAISGFIWGPGLLIPLLLGVGLFLTLRLGGLQFLKLGVALRLGLLERHDKDSSGDISHYQALTTALAATVGIGNIVGVASAIGIGGPGALFWMWVTGLVGMATKYAEGFLAVRFRGTDAVGEKSGGPQYYLERGIPGPLGKWLGLSFAVFATVAAFGIGNLTQANAIASNVQSVWGLPEWLSGLIMCVVALVVLVGGVKSIGRVTAALVPVMILLYITAALWVLVVHAAALPQALIDIFSQAFTGTSAVGGFTGSAIMMAIQFGVARGLFSNESGLGSAPIAAAAARTAHPVRQGLVSMTQTFIDTLIVVSFTGLAIIVTGAWQEIDPATGVQVSAALMTSVAFSHALPGQLGPWIVTISVILFAFSTILGWCYYGDRCVERLFGRRGVMPYRIVFSLMAFVGATTTLKLVWTFSDIMNGLMALPNLLGILLLSGLIYRETRHYLKHDPELRASKDQIEAFMKDQPGWRDWQAGAELGSSRRGVAGGRRRD